MPIPPDPPIRIDWIDGDLLADGAPGRLGLTILPGKHGPSMRYPGRVYRRDVAEDLATLHAAGVRRLILLVDDWELARWGDPTIAACAAEAGVDLVRAPIADGHAPSDPSLMDRILERIDEGRRHGDVAIACMGGIGRAGMVAACALVQAGMTADAAISAVRRVRHPEAVETAVQQAFVAACERRHSPGGR